MAKQKTAKERRDEALATLRADGEVVVECASTREVEALRDSLLNATNRSGKGRWGRARSEISRANGRIVLRVWLEEVGAGLSEDVVVKVLEALLAEKRAEGAA